jgi:hypothetical protein
VDEQLESKEEQFASLLVASNKRFCDVAASLHVPSKVLVQYYYDVFKYHRPEVRLRSAQRLPR